MKGKMNSYKITVTHLTQMHTSVLWQKTTKDLKVKLLTNWGSSLPGSSLSFFDNVSSFSLHLNKMCHSNKIEQLFNNTFH